MLTDQIVNLLLLSPIVPLLGAWWRLVQRKAAEKAANRMLPLCCLAAITASYALVCAALNFEGLEFERMFGSAFSSRRSTMLALNLLVNVSATIVVAIIRSSVRGFAIAAGILNTLVWLLLAGVSSAV